MLFTTLGFSKLPEQFNTGLNETRKFDHTAYNFPALMQVCEKLTRQILVKYGGKVEKDAQGDDVFVIPVRQPKPSKLELSWAPGPIAGSRFTAEEMARITVSNTPRELLQAVAKFAPGWAITNCGSDMNPGLRADWQDRKNVLVTHPLDKDTGCVLSRTVAIPAGKQTALRLVVGHDPQGDFDLIVRIDGQQRLRKAVSKDTVTSGHWLQENIDLSSFAGKQVKVELVNQPTGWSNEAAYWAEITLESK